MSDTNTTPVAFVRDAMLQEQPAPITAAGPVTWIKKNLFDGWFNTILTLAGDLLHLLDRVWRVPLVLQRASGRRISLAECREILQGKTGGCFSVLTERWPQLLFGFKYPSEEYWRPTIAFSCCSLPCACAV